MASRQRLDFSPFTPRGPNFCPSVQYPQGYSLSLSRFADGTVLGMVCLWQMTIFAAVEQWEQIDHVSAAAAISLSLSQDEEGREGEEPTDRSCVYTQTERSAASVVVVVVRVHYDATGSQAWSISRSIEV